MGSNSHSERQDPTTFVVALTGGIASGKTVVSNLFVSLGIPVIDTDVIAHEIVQPGNPSLKKIEHAFGKEYLTENGNLDRKRLRSLIMNNREKRIELESILHPAITTNALQQIKQTKSPYCVVVVPLLVGSELLETVNRVLVVDVSEDKQIARLKSRDSVSSSEALATLNAQSTRAERLAIADDVIENNGSLEELERRVSDLDRLYKKLAKSDPQQ